MSKKTLLISVLLAWGGAVQAADQGKNQDHIHANIPLQRSIDVHERNEAKNPQSQGLGNSSERTAANQERFDEKHGPGRLDRVEKVEKVERAERPERPERVERPERPDMGREIARGQVDRIDRPGLGKGR